MPPAKLAAAYAATYDGGAGGDATLGRSSSRAPMNTAIQRVLRHVFLTIITIAACGVMWWVSSRGEAVASKGQAGTAPPPPAAMPMPGVALADIRPEICESVIKHSGKIEPWESYSLGFEIGGRVLVLGREAAGKPLDDGSPVRAGQVLARLDDRILRARASEAIAQLEQAASDLRRARSLRDRGGQAITDAEYQDFLTKHALAKAQQAVAAKNLEDTVLICPVDGAVSRRMVEAGESVNPNAIVFEVVENADVLLVVNVPEARVRELDLRRRQVLQARSSAPAGDPEAAVFRARVQLEGRDRYGNPWPPIDAEVYRIAQVADAATGLFEVEVRIPNGSGLLRPGMVASATIVTDRLLAYRLPETAVIFRGEAAYIFGVREESTPVQAMFWPVGQTKLLRAERIDLTAFVDQGDEVLVPATAGKLGRVVVRGQQRLASGQLVRPVEPDAGSDDPGDATLPASAAATRPRAGATAQRTAPAAPRLNGDASR
ncbi:MAG: efflux RND transporter periplasmic adaptor subunit [Planctomycetota bacterium]